VTATSNNGSPAILYIECTLPDGQTIDEYRRSRPARVRGWRRLVRAGRASDLAR